MKKKFILLLISGFVLSACDIQEFPQNVSNWFGNIKEFFTFKNEIVDYKEGGYSIKEQETEKFTVTFYKNIGKEELDLNSGMYASTTTTAYKVDTVEKNSKVSRPEKDPKRVNYEFDGWHRVQNENSPFDFDTKITSNLVLYAHWTQTQEDDFVEPEYVEPSHVDDSIDTLVSISGVLNMPIKDGKVQLATASISRLSKDHENVVGVLNYKMKTGVTLTATYEDKVISYSAEKEGETTQNGTITVEDVSASLKIDNSTYEGKAQKYESNSTDFLDHRIMLAGSSSIENWKNSTNDLLPLTTYNHGIGGTTVEQWKNSLNQRLVYPYSPKIVVYYVGVNNIINTGTSPEQTSTYLTEMFDDVHAHLPNTHIYYVLINKLPNYKNKQEQFDQVNQTAIDYELSHDYVTTLNAGEGLLKANDDPNQAFFLFDGLHMSLAGYAIWGKFIKDKLISDMKKNA